MKKGTLLLLAILLLGLILAACGPNEDEQIATVTQLAANIYATQTAEYTPPTPTPTATPTPTPTPTLTPTPLPDAVILDIRVVMYGSPGAGSGGIDNLYEGDQPTILGQYQDCKYLFVEDNKGQQGWVRNDPENIRLNLSCKQIPPATFRAKNGELILSDRSSFGKGELTVSNGTGNDGILLLTDQEENPFLAYYIRAESNYTIEKIPDGVYIVFFSTGSGWDGTAFTENAHYQKFDDHLNFISNATQYTVWEITLHPVVGGGASTSNVNPEEFPSLSDE